MLGGIISVYTAGGAIGCLLGGPIGSRFGRKGTIQIGAIVAAIGTTLQTAAQETIMLIFGRLIAGLAIGIIYFAIPMFQSEISPASHRGLFVGLHAQFIGLGYMASNWVGFGVSYSSGQFTVRILTPILLSYHRYLPLPSGFAHSLIGIFPDLSTVFLSDSRSYGQFSSWVHRSSCPNRRDTCWKRAELKKRRQSSKACEARRPTLSWSERSSSK